MDLKITFINFRVLTHSCPLDGFHSKPTQETLSDSTNLRTHSTLIPNGDATRAELSAASASETQETPPTSETEAPTKSARSPELEGATEALPSGDSLSVV